MNEFYCTFNRRFVVAHTWIAIEFFIIEFVEFVLLMIYVRFNTLCIQFNIFNTVHFGVYFHINNT